MSIEASKDSVLSKYPWCINEDNCIWAAVVATTHRAERDMEELSFPILVCEREVFCDLSNNNLRALGEWRLRQENKA